jgi:SAM-dependent methyltransferase/predicted N-acetyltransferase YhbS
MQSQLTIRRIRPEEFDVVSQIIARTYLGEGHVNPNNPYSSALSDTASRSAVTDVYVALDGGVVVGSITFARAGNPYAAIARPGELEGRLMAVAPSGRRKGVATALMHHFLDTARSEGLEAAVFTIRPSMSDARRIYDRLGCVAVPERDWVDTDGTPLAVMKFEIRCATDGTFTNVDAVPEVAQRLVDYLDGVAVHPAIRRVRGAAMEILAPADGELLLDVGCGLGEVARELGTRVGPRGSVVAIDLSERMIDHARRRHDGGPVTYAVGDIAALQYPDCHFDAVHSERVLQHVPDPDAAVRELVRVTKPGGRVCIVDTDWSSVTWDGFDHLDEISAAIAPDRDLAAGRVARSRMVRAGLQETAVHAETLVFTSAADAAVVAYPLFDREYLRDQVPNSLFERYFASVADAEARGDFLCACTMWISRGRVPSVASSAVADRNAVLA